MTELLGALGPVVPQGEHHFLDTAAGMSAVAAAAGALGLRPLAHLRTSEYVVGTAITPAGSPVLLRAGDARLADWHAEELAMATAWARAGTAVVAPAHPELVLVVGAAVSVWPWITHAPGESADPVAAGRALARLHAAGPALAAAGRAEVFRARGWRAPGKIARRLLALEESRPALRPLLLDAAHRLAETAAAVPLGDATTVHGDYQPGNWLVTPAGPRVVDLATAGWGPPRWDLTLLAGRCGPGRRYPTAFWSAFCAGYGCDADVLAGGPEQRLRALSTAVAQLAHAPDAARAAQPLASLRALVA